jgi:exonuclease III
MRILSLNTFLIPKYMQFFNIPTLFSKINENYKRIHNIYKIISVYNPDVIYLQEVYDKKIREEFIKLFIKDGYNYIETDDSNIFVDNGIITFTKYKIIYQEFINFKTKCCNFIDTYAHRGILKTEIDKDGDKNILLNVHIQNWETLLLKKDKKRYKIANKQYKEVLEFINNLEESKIKFVCGGDFNLNKLTFEDKFTYTKDIKTSINGKQYDYILSNFSQSNKYKSIFTKYSDHYIVLYDL